MSKILSRYAKDLSNARKKKTVMHPSRDQLHKMSSKDIEGHYSKYFAESGSLENHIKINNEFDQIALEDLNMYEKWLMESD